MFLVAMVCIIYIPHLLESYCPEQQLPGVAEGAYAGGKAEHVATRPRNGEACGDYLSRGNMLEMPRGCRRANPANVETNCLQ